MGNRLMTFIVLLLSSSVLFSCQKSSLDIKGILKYINNPANGVMKERIVGGYNFQVKYLPIDYMVYRELEEVKAPAQKLVDSLKQEYKYSLNYILRIGPADDQSFDVTKGNAKTTEAYNAQNYSMNFELQEYLSLEIAEGRVLKPVLVRTENTYGLTDHRNINIVFSLAKDDLEQLEYYDLRFQDDLFNTGRHHFVFNKKDITNIPPIKF